MTAMAIGGQLLGAAIGLAGAQTQAAGAEANAAFEAWQSQFQGDVAALNYTAEAEADIFNAKVARQMARNARQTARAEASDFRRLQSARLSSSKARQAASGFTVEGSPLLVDTATFASIELGAARILHKGEVESTRLKNEASLLRGQAKVSKINATLARKAGKIGASYALQAGAISSKAATLSGYAGFAEAASGIGKTIAASGSFG